VDAATRRRSVIDCIRLDETGVSTKKKKTIKNYIFVIMPETCFYQVE
jgi:hypothetical protein